MALHQHHLPVTRTARYFTTGATGPEIRRIWLALHGHAMLAERFLELLAPLAGPGTLVVAPEALSRFYLGTQLTGKHDTQVGATWMTREDREAEIADAVNYLDGLMRAVLPAHYPAVPVGVLGFSQGVAVAVRWVARGAIAPSLVILWGAPPPNDVEPADFARRLARAPVHLVAGIADPVVPDGVFERAAETLEQVGAAVSIDRFAGGHVLNTATLRRLGDAFAARTP